MSKLKYALSKLICILIFFLFSYNGFIISAISICEFYYDQKELSNNLLYQFLCKLSNNKALYVLSSYTGFDTGYGFFAPNVASDCVIKIKILDKNNHIIEEGYIDNFIKFKRRESYIRFWGYTKKFVDLLDSLKQDSISIKLTDIYIKQICRCVYNERNDTNNIDHFESSVYIFDYPKLSERKYKGNEISLYEIRKIYVSKSSLQKIIY
ncbi:MAG: hypothetical protein Fur0023_13190 [Bacteroidia bacterium]